MNRSDMTCKKCEYCEHGSRGSECRRKSPVSHYYYASHFPPVSRLTDWCGEGLWRENGRVYTWDSLADDEREKGE